MKVADNISRGTLECEWVKITIFKMSELNKHRTDLYANLFFPIG